MKDFSNEQKVVFLTSIVSVLLLIYQVVSIRIDAKKVIVNKNRSKIENIKKLEASLKEFNDFTFSNDKDLFFYPEKKKVVVKKVVVKKIVKAEVVWRFDRVKPYGADNLKMLMYADGKVTIKIKGKNRKYKLGSKIPVGIKIQKEFFKSSGKSTGETRESSEYSGKILYFDSRNVYIELPVKKALLIGLRGKPKIISRVKVPASDSLEEDSGDGTVFRGRGRG